MKKKLTYIITYILTTIFLFQSIVFAMPVWPSDVGISSDAGIVMDSNSKAVIWGQNIHKRRYPASITKILTALIVIENCNLDDTLTFSKDAIYNVEAGSSSAGYDVGDTVTVRDALYALLLKSANEVANALAEHCAGSVEEFVKLMNEKAKELSCKDTHFSNPSGLNDENHYTSAYDYALIASEAFKNETLVSIASTQYYKLPVSKRNPEGLTVYVHHAMLRKNDANTKYYQYATCGKTGYTSLAGNTLVTSAKKDGMEIVSVILGSNHTHYTDTTNLMNFAFDNFKTIAIEENKDDYASLLNDLSLVTDTSIKDSIVKIDKLPYVTLPKDADIKDLKPVVNYELNSNVAKDVFATLDYKYEDRVVGKTYLFKEPLNELKIKENTNAQKFIKGLDDKIELGKVDFTLVFLIVGIIAFIILISMIRISLKRSRSRKIKTKNKYISSYKREKHFWEK